MRKQVTELVHKVNDLLYTLKLDDNPKQLYSEASAESLVRVIHKDVSETWKHTFRNYHMTEIDGEQFFEHKTLYYLISKEGSLWTRRIRQQGRLPIIAEHEKLKECFELMDKLSNTAKGEEK